MPSPTHAGGVVFRPSPAGPLFLVVGARREPSHWVLPKGRIEGGETPEAAAAREVAEEAGVAAEVVAPVGESELAGPRGPLRARFYLMRRRGDVPAAERRAVAWLPYEEACARLSFEDQRRLLDRARRRLDAAEGGPTP